MRDQIRVSIIQSSKSLNNISQAFEGLAAVNNDALEAAVGRLGDDDAAIRAWAILKLSNVEFLHRSVIKEKLSALCQNPGPNFSRSMGELLPFLPIRRPALLAIALSVARSTNFHVESKILKLAPFSWEKFLEYYRQLVDNKELVVFATAIGIALNDAQAVYQVIRAACVYPDDAVVTEAIAQYIGDAQFLQACETALEHLKNFPAVPALCLDSGFRAWVASRLVTRKEEPERKLVEMQPTKDSPLRKQSTKVMTPKDTGKTVVKEYATPKLVLVALLGFDDPNIRQALISYLAADGWTHHELILEKFAERSGDYPELLTELVKATYRSRAIGALMKYANNREIRGLIIKAMRSERTLEIFQNMAESLVPYINEDPRVSKFLASTIVGGGNFVEAAIVALDQHNDLFSLLEAADAKNPELGAEDNGVDTSSSLIHE